MAQIDREKFGTFVAELRKERNFTQLELAEKLFVSNKAVSKWERGMSLPDISLLEPLAEILDVTVTELLRGERQGAEPLDVREAEELSAAAARLSAAERERRETQRRCWRRRWAVLAAAALGAVGVTLCLGARVPALFTTVFTVELLCLIFGFWACFLAPDVLPTFYDRERISFFAQGAFRMNLPGVRFNNSNWPYMLEAMRWWCAVTPVVYPLLWLALGKILGPMAGAMWELPLCLAACLGLFIPVTVAGKKYESRPFGRPGRPPAFSAPACAVPERGPSA